FDYNVAFFAEDPVDVDRIVDGGDAIFRQEDHFRTLLLVISDQIFADLINFTKVTGYLGEVDADPLKFIIKMGQIHESQGRISPLIDLFGSFRYPTRGFNIGIGPPKRKQGELPQFLLKSVAEVHRVAV